MIVAAHESTEKPLGKVQGDVNIFTDSVEHLLALRLPDNRKLR
jgi:hypothetical protein